eukprot:TRINITY_DN6856_c0_g1_i1.p1 TRINITY_DN6856_c0_g1~~TRINITY_DN6856_c0_g1_i1.p1  ORF type:complete len:328 (-),score=26.18 TRINITY_DN6856_c0_g1_i1:45-1028(-)
MVFLRLFRRSGGSIHSSSISNHTTMSDLNNTTTTCNFRWTGVNCTTDNFTNITLVMFIGMYQAVFGLLHVGFVIYGVFKIIQKVRRDQVDWYSISLVTCYLAGIGLLIKCVYLADPFRYFGFSVLVYQTVSFSGGIAVVSSSILSYAIWMEIILSSKKVRRHVTFVKAKRGFIIAVIVLYALFFVELIGIGMILGQVDLFGAVVSGTAAIYAIAFIVVHSCFLGTINEVVSQTSSKKILKLNSIINCLVYITNSSFLFFAIILTLILSAIPATNELYLPLNMLIESFFRMTDLIMVFFIYRIVFDESKKGSLSMTGSTKSVVVVKKL